MPRIFLSPSTQEYNEYYSGGSEEYHMNQLADAMVPYLTASGIRYGRNNPKGTVVNSVALANKGTYDLYLSLHSNASPEGSEGTLQGPDIYYYPTSAKGRRAAMLIEDNMRDIYPTPELVNIIPSTYYYELRRTTAPAVLVEVAYHDNPADAKWITQNTDEIARALSKAVAEYLNVPIIEPSGLRQGTVKLNSGSLNIRSAPSTSSEIIGRAYNGDRVNILQTLPDWYKIDYNEKTGYVSSKYVIPD